MSKAAVIAALGCVILLSGSTAFGGINIAVIDNGNGVPTTDGQIWCQSFDGIGHTCTVFPKEGPTAPLDSFDTIVNMSGVWTDPSQLLPAFLQQGKTVVLRSSCLNALGINTDPFVREWIGASGAALGTLWVDTVTTDPILGSLPVGTHIGYCEGCVGLLEPLNSPYAKVLARIATQQRIGAMRNVWKGGVVVVLASAIWPGEPGPNNVVHNAVNARVLTIPTLGELGLAILSLGLLGCGGAIIRRRRRSTHG